MHQQQSALLHGYLAIASMYYTEEQCRALTKGPLQQYITLVSEAISQQDLADKTLIRHALENLLSEKTVEETILHTFLLHCFKLSQHSSNHPLERGIIKQKINGIIPIFKQAYDKGLIKKALFEKNVDALLHIAENTTELPEVHQALMAEYNKFTETN